MFGRGHASCYFQVKGGRCGNKYTGSFSMTCLPFVLDLYYTLESCIVTWVDRSYQKAINTLIDKFYSNSLFYLNLFTCK